MATIVAIYGAVLSTALAVGRLAAWLSSRRRRLTVRLFISPLVVDEDGQARVQNEQGHPAVQEGEAGEFLVIRCHNPGRRAVKVARVELVNSATGQSEHLTWLLMPTTIEPEEVQLWYSKIVNKKYPNDVFARVTLTDGLKFESPRYASLLGYLDPLNPIAGIPGGSKDYRSRIAAERTGGD